jgi:restriction system protein
MIESYEELMMPLFLRLGGDAQQLHMDQPLEEESFDHGTSIEEAANALASVHRAAARALEDKVLAYVYAQSPGFFEQLIIDLLLAMGYGGRKRDLVAQLGRSHDGGVDGIICQDPLGLELILLQGKRLKPNSSVSSGQVRDFIGTLETRQARKGVFVTTGTFSAQARSAVAKVSHRIKLIDGRALSALMVRHNLGVRPMQSFVFKELDRSYFSCRSTLEKSISL